MKKRFSLVLLLAFLLGLLPSMVAFSQTYTISPTGYTSKPSYQSLSNSWIGYTTGSNSVWIETQAVKSGSSVVFYVRKSSGTFQNSVSFKIRRDVKVSGSTVTSEGTLVGSGSIGAGKSSGTCTITPASGSHEYRVILTSGNMTFYTRIVTITVEAASPTKPSSPKPSNGATNVATSGTFSWSTTPNDGGSSISYDLYLDTNSSFSSSGKLYNSGQGKSCSYSNLKPGTKYYWKVIVYNSSGKSIWSDVWSFTTKEAASPTKPSSPNPSNGATNVATSGTFSWSTSPNDGGSSISYDLYLDTKSDFSSSGRLYNSGQGKSCSYSNLKPGTKYYWKVIVYNSSGKSTWSDAWSFTTKEAASPTKPSSPNPSNGATNVATSGTFSWSTSPNDGGSTISYDLYLDTKSGFSSSGRLYNSGQGKSCSYSNLKPGTTYYWKVIVYNSSGKSTWSDAWSFTTKDVASPTKPSSPNPSNSATNVATSGTFSWSTTPNDGGSSISYDLYLDTNSNFTSTGKLYNSGQGKSCSYSNLKQGTKYYWKVIVYNSSGKSIWSDVWSFTTTGTSDDMTAAEAAQYLYDKGVIENKNVDSDILRQDLAKVAFRGLYSTNGRTVPGSVISDNFPTVYEDLATQNSNNSYYFQAAKALLYLEYGDGVTPFDRNRLNFDPSGTIQRINVLKVLLETFNIQPKLSGSNYFSGDADVQNLASRDPRKYGYIRSAGDLGIINTSISSWRPYDLCTRGEAFLMLVRIMEKLKDGKITNPNPNDNAYFQPLNTTLKTMALGTGLQMGNFQHYTKTSFALGGVTPLVFAHTYNSYNTTLPEVFYGCNDQREAYLPLADGWSHSYHTFITSVDNHVIVHWGGGSIDVYGSDGSGWKPLSMGVYDQLTISSNTFVIKTKSQVSYTFGTKKSGVAYLTKIVDRNNNTLTISYETGENSMPRISSVSDGNGRQLTFYYKDGTNLIRKITDPLGRYIEFGYILNSSTGRYQLSGFKDAMQNDTRYYYVDNSKLSTSKLLSKIRLPKGNIINNQYNANNYRLIQTENGDTKTTIGVNTTYGSYGASATTSSDVSVTRSSGTSTYHYQFDSNNVMTSMSGPNSMSVSVTPYATAGMQHLPQKIATNSTNISNVEYDGNGNVTRVDVKGDGKTLTTKYEYNSNNDVTKITDPKGYVTTYSYTNGNLTKIQSPISGVVTNITRYNNGLPQTVTNGEGVTVEYGYDSYGNPNSIRMPLSISSVPEYDAAGRLKSVKDALGRITSYAYDKNDNLESSTDPGNHTTQYDYDSNDNLTSITNAKGGETSLSYDYDTDWLTSVSFAGASKNYSYNSDGTLASFQKPDGTTLNYSYDNLGRVKDDGINTYSYDSQTLRLTSITDKDSGKKLSLGYDGFGRVTNTSYNGHSNSYGYDDNGNCTNVNNTTYSYDKLNRLTSVKFSGKTITYTYRKDSQLSEVNYSNGLMITTYGYDAAGRLTSKKTKVNGSVVASYSFELDKVGNITQQTAKEPYGGICLNNEDVSYSYNSDNRITSAGDISFTFDENGNTINRGSEQYQWDDADRLIKAGSTAIKYDPLGLIASYGDISFTTDPLGIGNVLSDSKGAEYIYGNGLEARVKNGKVSYYVTDFRGSVVAIVDENGTITHKYQYDEFGKVVQKKEADYNPFQYVGKYGVMYLTDHQYYMRARHYDPTIGRFLSEDPIWSTNLYPYADNNPITKIDPMGKSSDEIVGIIIDSIIENVEFDTNIEVCAFLGVGGCGAFDVSLDKEGFGLSVNGTLGVGLNASASFSPSLTYSLSDKRQNPDKTSSVVLSAEFDPGVGLPGLGVTLESERNNQVLSANGKVGYVTVGGSVGDQSSVSIGLSDGIGAGIYAGVKGKSDKWYPVKTIKKIFN